MSPLVTQYHIHGVHQTGPLRRCWHLFYFQKRTSQVVHWELSKLHNDLIGSFITHSMVFIKIDSHPALGTSAAPSNIVFTVPTVMFPRFCPMLPPIRLYKALSCGILPQITPLLKNFAWCKRPKKPSGYQRRSRTASFSSAGPGKYS